jgi:cell division protein FtsB
MCYVRMLTGVDTNGLIAIGSLIVVLWIASMGGAWKIATILSQVANLQASVAEELKELRERTEENAQNINTIQSRFNIPQARNGFEADQISDTRH